MFASALVPRLSSFLRITIAASITAVLFIAIAPAQLDDGIRQQLQLPENVEPQFVPVAPSTEVNPRIVEFNAARTGDTQVLFQLVFSQPISFGEGGHWFVLYLDLDNDPDTGMQEVHPGIDVLAGYISDQPNLVFHNPDYSQANAAMLAASTEDEIYVLVDAPFEVRDDNLEVRVFAGISIPGGDAEVTDEANLSLPPAN